MACPITQGGHKYWYKLTNSNSNYLNDMTHMTKHEAVNQLWLVCFFKLLQLSYTWDWLSQQLSCTTQHRTARTILHLILQTIIAAQTMSTGGERERRPTMKCITVWRIKTPNQPTCTGEKHAKQTPTLTFTCTDPVHWCTRHGKQTLLNRARHCR